MRLRSDEKEMLTRSGSSSGNCARIARYGSLSSDPCESSNRFASSSIAHSVSLPAYLTTCAVAWSHSTSDLNDVLTTIASASSFCSSGANDDSVPGMSGRESPPLHTLTTVILPVVSVPVLSEQIVVALPIVSHALRCLTRFWSSIIFLTEKARAMVTASGRPSGTATTKTVTPTTRKRRYSRWWMEWSQCSLQHWPCANAMAKRTSSTATVRPPAMAPTLVMRVVMLSSFC
mmetsp:Transcript_48749/g.115777  ORF Transcript_48749/g.115777 Transcript_48749/m.115777 type:complete len:232 (+) Transcript_48749:1840-2535(+)